MAKGGVIVAILCLLVLCGKRAEATDKTIVFYMHDIVSGSNQTAKPVVPDGTTNNLAFGAITVIDDLLTQSADPSSSVVGRGQGMYITAAQDSSTLLLVFTAVLTSPEYNSSTISLQGADKLMQAQRDIPVLGGTGMFNFAQGYATMETASLSGFNAVLKFTVFLRY
ncbi:hypothetical protein SUGI_1064340 [Cryptomeria japonica]|uniref:dirigent protein 1 n=1 Tax=Cryptomeria japonica TaxID=3369 RepID=UPI0024149A86|nr:dirigent protein 1 [Cryptomeria japonica]GLJ50042.1 hypothetical protein SUGI_1064340 [Cryptomeria japonica]